MHKLEIVFSIELKWWIDWEYDALNHAKTNSVIWKSQPFIIFFTAILNLLLFAQRDFIHFFSFHFPYSDELSKKSQVSPIFRRSDIAIDFYSVLLKRPEDMCGMYVLLYIYHYYTMCTRENYNRCRYMCSIITFSYIIW